MPGSAPIVLESPPKLSARATKLLLAALFVTTIAIWFSSRTLLSTNFLPHWYCFAGNTRLLWTNVIADLLIGLSYVAISTTLVWLVRRVGRELPYSGFFWAFGLFSNESGTGETILVADDEAALRHAIVEILRTTGYKVLEAESSTEALEMARQHSGKIDVLLTDIVMPGLRGPELARGVAKVHPEVQVIYMSGYAQDFPEAQLPSNSTFLQKPFRFATLLEQLKLVRRRV
jgi:CheY-like chemotaxis protein